MSTAVTETIARLYPATEGNRYGSVVVNMITEPTGFKTFKVVVVGGDLPNGEPCGIFPDAVEAIKFATEVFAEILAEIEKAA
jgi:hypothetical protein